MKKLLTYAVMLDLLIGVYLQIMIMHHADRITESVKSGTKVSVWQDYYSPIRMNHIKN